MPEGVATTVYRATRGDERFYLRVLPEEGATFAPEVRAHQLARALGCRVPEVLAYAAYDPAFERSTMLTTEIPGRPLSAEVDPADARRIVHAAGRDLAKLNLTPVDGFGWVDRQSRGIDVELSGKHPDLDALLDSEYRRSIDGLPSGAVPGLPPTKLDAGLRATLEAARGNHPSRLVHGDFDTTHIFVEDGEYSGIIDFGEIRGMPGAYDLGHHLMHDRERLPYSTIDWLIEGYAESAPQTGNDLEQIRVWSTLIAARALYRGLERSPDSEIVATARRSLRRNLLKD